VRRDVSNYSLIKKEINKWPSNTTNTVTKSGGLSTPDFDLFPKLKKPLRGKRFRSIEEVSNEVTSVIRRMNNEGVQTGIQDLPKPWTTVIKHNGDYIEGL
jgi:hypothetical protein